MNEKQEENALWAALKDGDDTAKLALADWYAERGNPILAHALKWCVKRGHWPRVTPKERAAVWQRAHTKDRKRVPHKLPAEVFDAFRPRAMEYRWRSVKFAVEQLAFYLDRLMILCRVPGEGGAP